MKQKMVKRIMTGALTFAMAATSFAVVPATTANAASYVNLDENTQYVIVSRSSGKALTVEGDSTKAHANLVQQTLNNKDSQIWTLDYDNGYYYIINKKSGKVLDVPASSTEAGEQIIQDNKGKGDNQKFKISQVGSGYYKIAPKTMSDFSFNVYRNSKNNDGKIVQWPYEGNKNEQWEIRELESKASYRIEAEDMIFVAEDSDADLPKIIKNVPNASGGALVGNLNTENTLVAEFDVEKAGTYCVNVYYASKEVRAFGCLEDPEYPQLCDVTGGWTTVGNEPMTFVVDLEKGKNSLSFSTPFYEESMWSPNVDYIEVVQCSDEGNKEEQSEVRQENGKASYRIEAEDMILDTMADDAFMPKIIKNAPKASGGALVGDLYTDNCLEAVFDVEEAGFYTVNVYYASKEVRALYCHEDPEYPKLCEVTGGWTTVGSKPMKFIVELEKGENSLSFSTPFYEESMWSPNIDYIEVVKN